MKQFERELMVIDAACRANFEQSEGAETEEIDREYVKLRYCQPLQSCRQRASSHELPQVSTMPPIGFAHRPS